LGKKWLRGNREPEQPRPGADKMGEQDKKVEKKARVVKNLPAWKREWA